MPVVGDAKDVLSALRLGWCLAEMRGRNRPWGPPGDVGGMPDHIDHALPLRIERSKTELRIEVQSVIAQLAKDLHVDDSADGTSFGAALDDKAKLLGHARAPKASEALQKACELLQKAAVGPAGEGEDVPAMPWRALQVLHAGLAAQQAVAVRAQQDVATAQQVLAGARRQLAAAAGRPAKVKAAEAARAAAAAAMQLEQTTCTGEARGVAALNQVIGALQQAIAASPETAAQTGVESIRQCQREIENAAHGPWEDLAELIWRFDVHVQDRLTATSESQAIGYQLGRGLAETYWALDPGQVNGSSGWSFLLGERRCNELSRLTGRLAAYMDEYTGPAIAGSVEVWKDVAKTPAWLGDVQKADQALYSQIRRWYELIILGQDPTTLIEPAAIMKNYRTLGRAVQLFWPQLAATIIGLGFLVALVVLLSVGRGAAWEKTLSAILAAGGLSLAGLTGTLKNSAQAMLKRLRQDAYTDLVAIAVQTAPPPPKKSDIRNAISRRKLTLVTPN